MHAVLLAENLQTQERVGFLRMVREESSLFGQPVLTALLQSTRPRSLNHLDGELVSLVVARWQAVMPGVTVSWTRLLKSTHRSCVDPAGKLKSTARESS